MKQKTTTTTKQLTTVSTTTRITDDSGKTIATISAVQGGSATNVRMIVNNRSLYEENQEQIDAVKASMNGLPVIPPVESTEEKEETI